jgi:tetratricopeptide (TPR) repeat protein
VQVWDVQRNRSIAQSALPGGLYWLAVDPQGRLLAVVSFFGEVRILSLPDLKVRGVVERYDVPGPIGLAFRNDGQWLATGGTDRRVTIWNTRTLARSFILPPVSGPILDLAFQPGGSRLAVATVGELIPVWDFSALEADLAHYRLLEEVPSADSSAGDASTAEAAPPLRRFGAMVFLDGLWEAWVLDQVLEAQSDQPRACMELAWLRAMGPKALRDPDEALRLARRAVELAPQSPDCLNTLGVACYRMGRWDEAVETLEASARANPQGASGYDRFFLAMSCQKLGQADRAREEFDLATELWSSANLNAAQADELNAIRSEAELVLQGQDDPPATAADQRTAGQAYASAGLWAMAVRHFVRGCQLAPDDPQQWEECGRSHAHLSEWQEAIQCFAKARELNPGNIEFWYRHAIAHLGAGDTAGYKQTCASMVDRFRDSADPAVASRIMYACLPMPDAGANAEELVQLARVAIPWFRGNERVLGAALYRAGQYDSALEQFAELDKVGGPKAWDCLFEAMAHARLNHRDEAKQCLERAIAWMDQADRLDFGSSLDRWVDWFEPVEVRLLLREAEEIVK